MAKTERMKRFIDAHRRDYTQALAADRIRKMEQIFDELRAVKPEESYQSEEIKEQLKILKAYYEGGQWLADYELDEKGMLSPDLKRGVLSQDGIYNLLNTLKENKDEQRVYYFYGR